MTRYSPLLPLDLLAGDPIDIAAALRRQLDEAQGKRVDLERQLQAADARNAHLARQVDEVHRQVEDIRGVLLRTACDVADANAVETRDRAFWAAAWANERARYAEMFLKLGQVERWHREQGAEAARLQTALDVEREEAGRVRRLLDASEARVAELEAHVARLTDTIANREAG